MGVERVSSEARFIVGLYSITKERVGDGNYRFWDNSIAMFYLRSAAPPFVYLTLVVQRIG